MDRISLEFDPQLHNVTLQFSTVPDGVSSTVYNITIEYFQAIYAAKMEFKINVHESPSDTKYMREFFRTSLDFKKLFGGINGNSILKGLAGRILKSMNFEVRFPLPPGVYKFTNLTFTGYVFPPISLEFRINARFFAKYNQKKKMNISSKAVIFGKLN